MYIWFRAGDPGARSRRPGVANANEVRHQQVVLLAGGRVWSGLVGSGPIGGGGGRLPATSYDLHRPLAVAVAAAAAALSE